MMFGSREEFTYFQCNACDCLQIDSTPPDLGSYYPPNYYSYNDAVGEKHERSWIEKTLVKWITINAIAGRGYKLSRFAQHWLQIPEELREVGPWLRVCKIDSLKASFLDIGCGARSRWLEKLESIGFSNLFGVDPFIKQDVTAGKAEIFKRDIDELNDRYDCITLHHSLEHIPDQIGTLKKVRALLTDGGVCLVRIPVVTSAVWDEYGVDWAELDAPRHLYLHSLKSIEMAAEGAGLKMIASSSDSTEFEFFASEQYRRGIPLMAENSFAKNPGMSDFTYREMTTFKAKARKAVSAGKGGRGCFFFVASA